MAATEDQFALFPELGDAGRLRLSRSRLFFALWPGPHLRRRLNSAALLVPPGENPSTYRVRPERLHLTLAFLGELDARQIEAACAAGDAVRADRFGMRIDRVGHFEGANVAWLGPSITAPGLARLKAELDRELLHVHLPVDTGVFVPHITCLRRIRERPDAPELSLDWQAEDFVLVRSARDRDGRPAGYKVLKRWPLRSKDLLR